MSSYGNKEYYKDFYNNNPYKYVNGYLPQMKPYKYYSKVTKKDPGIEQKKKIVHWLKDLSIEDRGRVICIDNQAWLTILILKIFWVNRLKNYNAFTLKPEENIENLTKMEYKLKNVEEYLKFHKVNTSDFCMPNIPMQRNNRCML